MSTCPRTPNLLTRMHADMTAYLRADEKMRHAQVIREGERLKPEDPIFEKRVEHALGGNVPVNGKAGLAVILFAPTGEPESRANGGLCSKMEYIVRTVEALNVNAGPFGTGIACEDMHLEVMLLLQMWAPLTGHALRIEEFYKQPTQNGNLIIWECVLITEDAQTPRPKCVLPRILPAGLVTLTCGTAEAQIYYTTDGSLPTPQTGLLYSAPFDAEGVTVRATAWKSGMRGSDCAELAV